MSILFSHFRTRLIVVVVSNTIIILVQVTTCGQCSYNIHTCSQCSYNNRQNMQGNQSSVYTNRLQACCYRLLLACHCTGRATETNSTSTTTTTVQYNIHTGIITVSQLLSLCWLRWLTYLFFKHKKKTACYAHTPLSYIDDDAERPVVGKLNDDCPSETAAAAQQAISQVQQQNSLSIIVSIYIRSQHN